MLEDHLENIFGALDRASVRYLVVGGLAVVAHGHARFTADLDLVIALDEGNIRAAITVLQGLGYEPRAPVEPFALAVPEMRRTWAQEKGMVVFQLFSSRQPETAIDIFVEAPFDFEAEYTSARRMQLLETRSVSVVSLSTLMAMKRTAGRPQDLEDIRQLGRLHS